MQNKLNIQIIIVEDNPFFNKLLTRFVRKICHEWLYPTFEFEIKSCFNAHDCLLNLKQDTDFILLDYHLDTAEEPEVMDAADIIQQVNRVNPACKIIVISAADAEIFTPFIIEKKIFQLIQKNTVTAEEMKEILRKIMLVEVAKLANGKS